MIEIEHPGAFTTVQDLGRAGYGHLGVSRSGAADRDSLKLANRLVGNPEADAGLECTLDGPRVRLHRDCTVAITGAPVDIAALDGIEVSMNCAFPAPAGSVLQIGRAVAGVRSYVAFSGGIAAAPILGSRSWDMRGEIGPPPVAAGAWLALGDPTSPPPAVDAVPVPSIERAVTVTVSAGPRASWFTAEARRGLRTERFVATGDANRIGVKLRGPALTRQRPDELRSEGMVPGAVQVPPSGQPIVLLADVPTTGGYPVIAVVAECDLGKIAQLRPGDEIRFAFDGTWGREVAA
ncbi:biotin-dependent carboxyltransferase family protein [Patulibacter americanus]|uniref:5-oxoprolinase subunit C family protein n=1 Tax=Patulibacter americanus TaxID=588672 RepID=UPI0003B7B976|nr:biotin-dependent carboxyltransferase family protein [Patulibacter americanus]